MPEVSVGSTVQIIHGHNVVASAEHSGDSRSSGKAASESYGVFSSIKRCQASFKGVTGWISTSSIFVS